MIEAREAHDNLDHLQTELQRERQGWEQEREEWQAKLGNEASASSQLMHFQTKVDCSCRIAHSAACAVQLGRLDEVQAQLCSLTAKLADTEVPAVLNRAVS